MALVISNTTTLNSPCISVCQMDEPTGWCKGCYRSLDEIASWGQSSDADKRVVWQQLLCRHMQINFSEARSNTALLQACRMSST